MEQPKRLLWLDDKRNPHEGDWLKFSPISKPFEVHWVKDYDEFVQWLIMHGLPDGICFDHDLEDEHYTPEEYWDCYHKSKAYQDAQDYKKPNGVDCAKFLIEYCDEHNKRLPKWYTHSHNPVGRDNINRVLIDYLHEKDNLK